MQIIKKKYVKSHARIFLFAYIVFLSVSIFHYHNFDLDKISSYSGGAESYPYTDLTTDFYSVCAIHQFIQTIDDFHFSSSDIIQALSEIESFLNPVKIKNFCLETHSLRSPRAPPLFIS